MSDDARDILRELLAEALAGTNGNGVTPQVPPPPVAAVHRPATWEAPAGGVERVTIGGDDDLNRFVRDLLTRADRDAILAGRVRFTLGDGEPLRRRTPRGSTAARSRSARSPRRPRRAAGSCSGRARSSRPWRARRRARWASRSNGRLHRC